MQYKKAADLRKSWKDAPCNHPSFEKEYILGSDTGDYICTRCGKVFTKTQKDKLEDNG